MTNVSPSPVAVVELLGPSGSGKTTLLDHFFSQAYRLPSGSSQILSRAVLEKTVKLKSAATSAIMDDADVQGWLDFVFLLLARAPGSLSRRLKALDFCRRALVERELLSRSDLQGQMLLHDELLLHRAFSILPFSRSLLRDAELFFQHVPLPQKAIICFAQPQTIATRISGRKNTPNCYKGLSSKELDRLLVELVEACFIAQDVLTSRGLPCTLLSLDEAIETNCARLVQICGEEQGL